MSEIRRESMVRVEGLVRSFQRGHRTVEVLKGLDLEVPRGEFLAITGRSGVGKSTLLQLLGGLDRPSGGRILVDGEDVGHYNGAARADFRSRRIGFVFQFHHLLPEFTALENVMIPALIRRSSRGEARGKAVDVLERMDLKDRMDHKPGELSGGEQQRVALARALVGRPALLLMDEPTGNLDGATSERIHRLIREILRSSGTTCVLVTHDDQLAGLADRRLQMADGRIEASSGRMAGLHGSREMER